MKPMIQIAGARVFLGDCREVLKTLPDNSVDSIVTDPPYGLGFMGKEWDSFGKKGGISDEVRAKQQEKWGTKFAASAKPAKPSDGEMLAFQLWCTEWATECLRVLKPGGHILAFGGSRTWHRLAVAVEDAGFELRDSIAWLYGSGFPKSLDVSKAIDKGQGLNTERRFQFTAWMKSTGITAREIDQITGTKMGHHYTTHATQPAIATADLFDKLRPYLPEVPEAIERLVAERTGIEWTAYKQREVIGQRVTGAAMSGKKSGLDAGTGGTDFGSGQNVVDETAPATPEAQKWQGWGTALKPAFEPVVVGRKPFGKGVTVAENVLEWGVGGLNIDGSRIGTDEMGGQVVRNSLGRRTSEGGEHADFVANVAQGRWPANVILDEVTAGLLDEQSGVSKSPAPYVQQSKSLPMYNAEAYHDRQSTHHGDSGGASRFFYVAKASKRDRNEGLEELQAKTAAEMTGRKEGSAGLVMKHADGSDKANAYAGTTGSARQNFHPTVKPTQLMRYLIKLVTPPGGTVLDPFTGSGSTGKAALLDGFQFVGAELTEEYLPIIEGRLRWASEQEAETDDTLF